MNKNIFTIVFFATCIMLFLLSNYVHGANKIRVIDGDTVVFNGVKLRLAGIDAPEKKQVCTGIDKKFYNCGKESKRCLEDAMSGNNVYCTVNGKDRWNRIISTCYNDGVDINGMLVLLGHAVAYTKYSDKYINEELEAKEKKRGVWQGIFEMPWDYRKNNRKK